MLALRLQGCCSTDMLFLRENEPNCALKVLRLCFQGIHMQCDGLLVSHTSPLLPALTVSVKMTRSMRSFRQVLSLVQVVHNRHIVIWHSGVGKIQ